MVNKVLQRKKRKKLKFINFIIKRGNINYKDIIIMYILIIKKYKCIYKTVSKFYFNYRLINKYN